MVESLELFDGCPTDSKVPAERKPLSYTGRTITQTDVAVARAHVAEFFEAAYLIRSVRIAYRASQIDLMAGSNREYNDLHARSAEISIPPGSEHLTFRCK
jgi:hypothetical protein